MEQTRIKPSPEARQLFNDMVNNADENLHLALTETLAMSILRAKLGLDREAAVEITELVEEGWIKAHSNGGWVLA